VRPFISRTEAVRLRVKITQLKQDIFGECEAIYFKK
jgi:hypothetical protein